MFLRRLRENSHVIAILLALCLALTAQYLFTGEIFTHHLLSNTWDWTPTYSLALVLLILATGLATWAALPRTDMKPEATAQTDEPKGKQEWLIGAGVCYLLSILLYLFMGENILVQLLWVAGIGLLIIPLWLQIKTRSTDDKISNWEWAVVGIISLIGFLLRYLKLTEIPFHVDNDVALMGTYGLELIKSGNYNWIGFSGSEHLLSYDQFLAWSMRLFGQNHYGIVMHSVVLGTLSLPFIFLLGRELGGKLVGFMAIGLLTISYTHIHFSRILFGNSASFAMIFVMYAFFRGIRTHEPLWFALTGVFPGWGILLYDSDRVIPVVMLSVLVWQWLWQRQALKFSYKNWGVLLAGIVLGFGPMLASAAQNFTAFSGRTNTVALWTPRVWEHELATYHTTSAFEVLWQQTWRAFLTLHLTADGSPHFSIQIPMVSSLTAALFILGLGYSFMRIKDIKYFSILSWIFCTFIFGGVLTADPPYWPHLNIALPAIILVAAMGTESIAEKITLLFGQVGHKIYTWILVCLIIITGITNWQVYYDFAKTYSGPRLHISRYLTSLPAGYTVYMAASPYWSWNEHVFRFFNQGIPGQDLTPETLATTPPTIKQPTIFILFDQPDNTVSVLKSLYPEGQAQNHYDFDNRPIFISYRIVPPGYDLKPVDRTIHPLSLPGWWIIFGVIVVWVGRAAYRRYGSTRIAVIKSGAKKETKSTENARLSLSNTDTETATAQITIPLDIPNVRVLQTTVGEREEIIITIESTKAGAQCRKCGKWITKLYGQDEWVRIKYLPAFGRQTYLRYRPNQYQCQDCKGHPITTQYLD